MICVIEGVDGVGKSSLALELAKQLRDGNCDWVTVAHYGPPPYDEHDMTTRSVQAAADLMRALDAHGPNHHVIIDRWSWGCPVYGPLFRPELDMDGYGELGRDMFFVLEDALHAAGGKTFWIDAPDSVIVDRLGGRGDWYLSEDFSRRMAQIDALRDNYQELIPKCKTAVSEGGFQLLTPHDTVSLARSIVKGKFHA